MTYHKKIAVFDLDGTLWKYNSHIEILNAFYNTRFFSSVCYRALNKFFKKRTYAYICAAYKKIPRDYALNFNLPFDEEKISLLKKKQRQGFFALIVSNAPYELCAGAAKRLGVAFLTAPVGHKLEALNASYSYDELFVCTDNIDDVDIIEAASEKSIVLTKYNRAFFAERRIV